MYENDYKNRRWQRLRASVLKRDGYQCQLSKRYGKTVPAEMVHHVFPLREFPEYRWEPWNLISLSQAMHNTLHDRNTDALTQEGVDLLRRTARKFGKEIPEQYR